MGVPELTGLIAGWETDFPRCVRETFLSDPYGHRLRLDPAQAEILQAVQRFDRVAVRSGRGVGKTATAAMLTHAWLATYRPALVVTSAGTWAHLADKLWPEIHAWARHWRLRDAFEYQTLGIYHLGDPNTWRAVGVSSDKAVNLEGFHGPNLLLIVDEAKGMPDDVFAGLLGSLSGKPEMGRQVCVLLSTPPTTDVGFFARACASERWHQIHISGLDSPRVSSEYVDEIADTFGENSAEYMAYVEGEIPEGVAGQLIHGAWVKAAQGRKPKGRRAPVVTCDVARGGEDLCTFGLIAQDKFNLVRFEDRWGWLAQSTVTQVVARCATAVVQHKAKAICVDDTGLGGGVTDGLRELQASGGLPADCTIWPINFGAAPRRPDRFFLRKHEMWWEAREAVRTWLALPTDAEIREWRTPRGSDFKTQLTAAIYESDPRERVVVYDKRVTGKEVTKALPSKSPDLAHALILGASVYWRQPEPAEVRETPSTQEEALSRMLEETVRKAHEGRRQGKNPFERRR